MDAIKMRVASLPDQPGIYRFYNQNEQLIYVGKAKNIKKRVGSYFSKQSSHSQKTRKLVSEIQKIDSTIVSDEFDALLLENNFIKQYQPKYNILLKDDKTFPFICIVDEPFPRIISTRKYNANFGEYFGPFTSVVSLKSVLDLIRKLYSIRTCALSLTEKNISSQKFKVCLEYHIGNCLGPCVGHQNEAHYLEEINQCKNILKGNLSIVEKYFSEKMKAMAKDQQYEKAELYKNRLDLLNKFHTKSLVVNKKLTNVDVVAITSVDKEAFVNYLQITEGSIILSKNIRVKKQLDESDEHVLSLIYLDCRNQFKSVNKVIYSNKKLLPPSGIRVVIPKIGDKRKLVELSLKNALHQKEKSISDQSGRLTKNDELLFQIQNSLRLKEIPRIIECFDNSNFQGTTPVSSMVRFTNGKPNKKEYRHYHIKTVIGADDFASMKEVVLRRYGRLKADSADLPHLIVIDGGKGQLASAKEALMELELYGKIPIIGVAKRLEEVYYPEDSLPLLISKKSPALFLLQRIRNEAHRFAITFHRQVRSKKSLTSSFDQIKGIGVLTMTKLLKIYKSKKNILSAPEDELAKIIGSHKAKLVKEKGA